MDRKDQFKTPEVSKQQIKIITEVPRDKNKPQILFNFSKNNENIKKKNNKIQNTDFEISENNNSKKLDFENLDNNNLSDVPNFDVDIKWLDEKSPIVIHGKHSTEVDIEAEIKMVNVVNRGEDEQRDREEKSRIEQRKFEDEQKDLQIQQELQNNPVLRLLGKI